MARPKKDLDIKLLKNLAKIQCTQNEVCGIVGVTDKTLVTKLKEFGYEGFSDFLKKEGSDGKMSLRRKQFEPAMQGNVPMLIFLGKQWLGQKDKVETSEEMPVDIGSINFSDVINAGDDTPEAD